MATTKELAPINSLAAEIQAATDAYGPAALAPVASAMRCFQLAEGVRITRSLVQQALPYVTHLKGTRLGFLTDRDPGKQDKYPPYGDAVIVECLTEALLRGARWTDNEINILFGSVHYTLQYWRRVVSELPDLTDLEGPSAMPPKMFDGGATVDIGAKFKLRGDPVEMRRVFTVRLTSGMGADGAIGKATRRMLAAVYHRVTGSQHSSDAATGADDQDTTPQPGKTEALAGKMNGQPPRQVEATTEVKNGNGHTEPKPEEKPAEKAEAKPEPAKTIDPEEISNDGTKFTRLLSDKGWARPRAIEWVNKEYEEKYPSNTKLTEMEPIHGKALAEHLLSLPDAAK